MGKILFVKNKMTGSGMQTMKYEKRGMKGGFIRGILSSIGLGNKSMHGGFLSSVLSSIGLGVEPRQKNVRKLVRQVL